MSEPPRQTEGVQRRSRFQRVDVALLIIAAISLLVYIGGQPRVHPDGLAARQPAEEAAISRARDFLAAHGHDVSSHETVVRQYRNARLFNLVQRFAGRRAFILAYADDPNRLQEEFPLHYTAVAFDPPEDAEGTAGFDVELSSDGRPWRFHRRGTSPDDTPAEQDRVVDRSALSAMIAGGNVDDLPDGFDLGAYSDSVLARSFVYPPNLGAMQGTSDTLGAQSRNPADRPRRTGLQRPVVLGATAAAAMARFHLRRTGLVGWRFAVDSVWSAPGERDARVRFRANRETVTGDVIRFRTPIENRTTIDVSAAGALRGVAVEFGPEPEGQDAVRIVSFVLSGSVYLFLAGLLLVTFFRRLMSRTIDVKAALIDGVLVAASFVALVLATRGVVENGGVLWVQALAIGAVVVVGGTAVALLSFMASGAADSLGRRGWSKKLIAAGLIRRGSILNSLVGASLLRGLASGFVLLGVTTLSMWVFGNVPVDVEASSFASESLAPVVGAFGLSALLSFVQTIVLVLTAASILYSPGRSNFVPLAGICVALMLGLTSLPGYESAWVSWASSLAVGVVVAAVFKRFDVVAVFVALSSSYFVWLLQDGWLLPGSGTWVHLLIAGLFLGLVAGAGFVGVARGRRASTSEDYVPSYIREMRQQERMQRELEIARQVQESFLPKEMPSIKGVDLAAMCTPAQVVGGDYYDLIKLDDHRIAVTIGDVSGKGIQAAFFMTLTKGFVRTLCREDLGPAAVLKRMNRLFAESAPRGVFMSIIYGIIDVDRREFQFARAGHTPVITRSSSGAVQYLKPDGIGIGLDRGGEFDRTIGESTIDLTDTRALILYTDGFPEARSGGDQEYGDERLLDTIARADANTAQSLIDDVYLDVEAFVGGAQRHDDMTILVVRLYDQNEHD